MSTLCIHHLITRKDYANRGALTPIAGQVLILQPSGYILETGPKSWHERVFSLTFSLLYMQYAHAIKIGLFL